MISAHESLTNHMFAQTSPLLLLDLGNNRICHDLLTGAPGAIVSRVSAGRAVTKDHSAWTIGKILSVKTEAPASTNTDYTEYFNK